MSDISFHYIICFFFSHSGSFKVMLSLPYGRYLDTVFCPYTSLASTASKFVRTLLM